jgi:hypothetical protein
MDVHYEMLFFEITMKFRVGSRTDCYVDMFAVCFKALPQSRYSFNVMLKVTLTLMLCYTQKLSFFFTMMLCSLDVI